MSAAELVHRFDAVTATDRIADVLLFTLGRECWPEPLRDAFLRWLSRLPARAVAMVLHALQAQQLRDSQVATAEAGGTFTAVATLTFLS